MATNYPGSNFSGSPPGVGGSVQGQQDPFAAAAAIAAQTAASLTSQLSGKATEQGNTPSFSSGGHGDRGFDDRRQLFVGGIPEGFTDDDFHRYFSQFGNVERSIVMTDKMTGRCRGFGFVTYATTGEVENCLANGPHQLNGKHVDVNRSQDPKDAHKGGWGSDRSGGPSRRGGGGDDPKKVFCGGLPQDCDTERLRQHFSQYGNIVDCIAMRDRDTGRSKGYGFVTFDSEDAVNAAINGDNTIDGRWVEVRNSQRFGGSDGSSQGKGRGWGSFESQGYGDAYSQAAAAAMQQGWAGMAAQQAAYYPYAAYYGSYQAGQQGGQAGQMDPYAAYYAAMAAAASQQQQQPVAAASQETPQQQPQQSYPSGGGASISADAGRSNPY